MEYLDVGKKFLDLATTLMGLSETYSKDDRECRDRLAVHLDNLVVCLEKSATDPHIATCAELDDYLESLKNQLVSVLPAKRIEKFDALLSSAVEERSMTMAMGDETVRKDILVAAGRFKALASEIRVA